MVDMIAAIQSFRILTRNWKLAVVAVFSLSVAMALGVLALSISNTFLLLTPSAVDPTRLVTIHGRTPEKPVEHISYPDYTYLRDNNRVFTDIAAAPETIQFQEFFDKGGEVKVLLRPVSDNYFSVLGTRPYLGRLFAKGDDDTKTPLAVMTYTCWKRLGADPKVVGKTIGSINIVGVTPPDFTGSMFGVNGDLLVPLSAADTSSAWRTRRDDRRLILLARLKPGVSKSHAEAALKILSAQLASAYPKEDKKLEAVLTRATLLPPDALGTAELMTGLLMGVVLLVLLIACANVANLLLAVALGRRQEAAIKLALGVRRGRLIREFLWESLIICVASALAGYCFASLIIARYSTLSVTLPVFGTYELALNFHLDTTVFVFTAALMLIAVLAAGLAPALYASSPDVSQLLSGEIGAGGRHKNTRRNILVIVQVAVCTLVLVGMGLCQRSLYNLRHVDPGFSARNLVAVTVYPENEHYSEVRGRVLYQNLRRSVAALAGVESVTLASHLPLLGENQTPVQVAGGKNIAIGNAVVDSNYFATLAARILIGRAFNSSDQDGGPDALIVNHKLAEMFWPGQEALGRTLMTGDPPRAGLVVGVASDGKYGDLDESAQPFFYYALSQHYQGSINIIARTQGDPRLWIEPLSRAVRATGLQALLRPLTFDNWLNVTLITQRIAAGSVAVLSALALLLAVVGLFGAISYSVTERKKELGIRVALGARPVQLLEMILRQTLLVAGTGVAIGLVLGITATVLLRSQFYAISPIEWTVLVPVGLAMTALSLAVAYLSARPWITIDPMQAVRHA